MSSHGLYDRAKERIVILPLTLWQDLPISDDFFQRVDPPKFSEKTWRTWPLAIIGWTSILAPTVLAVFLDVMMMQGVHEVESDTLNLFAFVVIFGLIGSWSVLLWWCERESGDSPFDRWMTPDVMRYPPYFTKRIRWTSWFW